MPIDLDKALGAEMDSIPFTYNEDDVILYALGIGAGVPPTDPAELAFTYENGLKVLPTFGVVPPFPALTGMMSAPGIAINPMMLLHGEQYLEVKKHPIPTSGTLITRPKIASIFDKGKGALIIVETVTSTEAGEDVFFNAFSLFVRGEGGFGGERGPEPGNEPPERDPDNEVEMKTLPQQALIYRLSGDKNPLHADPSFAAMGGFDKPILHGLCSFGHVGRAVLKTYGDNDPARFASIKVRFARHVFPGETILVQMWDEGEGRILVRAKVKERDENVITNAAVTLNI